MNKSIKILKLILNKENYVAPLITSNHSICNSLIGHSHLIVVEKGNILYNQGEVNEHVYIVDNGKFLVSFINKQGNEKCICLAGKGSMLGEISVIDNIPNYASCIAMDRGKLYKLTGKKFLSIILEDSVLTREAMKSISMKLRIMNSKWEDMSKNAYSRFLFLLASLAIEYGIELECRRGILINIKLTHQELANLTCLNRVTISRIHQDLVRQKIITKKNRHIIINNVLKIIKLIE